MTDVTKTVPMTKAERRAAAVEVLTVQLRDVLDSAGTWRAVAEDAARQMAMQTQRDDATIEILKNEAEILRTKYSEAVSMCSALSSDLKTERETVRRLRALRDPVQKRERALEEAIRAHGKSLGGETFDAIIQAAMAYEGYIDGREMTPRTSAKKQQRSTRSKSP